MQPPAWTIAQPFDLKAKSIKFLEIAECRRPFLEAGAGSSPDIVQQVEIAQPGNKNGQE